jgi:hypothetical protein
MKITIIHVNRHTNLRNRKHNTREPEIAVRNGRSGKADYAHSVDILDAQGNVVASIGSHHDKPLPCGATIWLECKFGVTLHKEANDGTAVLHEGSDQLPEKLDDGA